MKMSDNEYPLVKDFFPILNGIFTHSNYDFEVITKEELDTLFYSNYGYRAVSPLATNLAKEMYPSDIELSQIASFLISFYKIKWDKLKEVYQLEYDPIHNYLDELVETIEDSGTKEINTLVNDVRNFTQAEDTTSLRSDNLTRTENNTSEEAGTNNVDASIYGFNSTKESPSDSSDSNSTNNYAGTSTVENTGNQSNTINQKNNSNEERTSNTDMDITTGDTRSKKSTHKGNIGNLTTQQLISQEVQLRRWNFIETVLDDAKELLTIPIYL